MAFLTVVTEFVALFVFGRDRNNAVSRWNSSSFITSDGKKRILLLVIVRGSSAGGSMRPWEASVALIGGRMANVDNKWY